MRISPIAQQLYNASRRGNTEEAKRLIEIKAPVDWQNPDKAANEGATPLLVASQNGKTNTARLLIESKAAVDKDREDGVTPLYITSYFGNTDTARLLIESKAAVDKADRNGTTPLFAASQEGKTGTVRLLIESKAAVDKANNVGDAPLIIAAYKNQMSTVRALVESGADTTIRGLENKTAAECSSYGRGIGPIAQYLHTLRFQPSARNESGELHKEQGRAPRAATRDLVDIAGFDRDMMGLLNQFCTGMR